MDGLIAIAELAVVVSAVVLVSAYLGAKFAVKEMLRQGKITARSIVVNLNGKVLLSTSPDDQSEG